MAIQTRNYQLYKLYKLTSFISLSWHLHTRNKCQQSHQNIRWGLKINSLVLALMGLCFPSPDMLMTTGICHSMERSRSCSISHNSSRQAEIWSLLCFCGLSYSASLKPKQGPSKIRFYNAPVLPELLQSTALTTFSVVLHPVWNFFLPVTKEYLPDQKASCSQTTCCWAWRADGQGR